MNFLEMEIAKLNRRLEKIEANPDPRRLKTNKMRYELERDMRVYQLDRWRNGGLFAIAIGSIPRALGFETLNLMWEADRTTDAADYFDKVRNIDLPMFTCDRTVVGAAMVMSGTLPPPNFVQVMTSGCEPFTLMTNALAEHYNVPKYVIDIGFEMEDRNLRYVAEQLGEMIEFVEAKVPGAKFDRDYLIELHELDRQAFGYLHEIYELKKRVPCPVSGKDSFRLPRPPSWSSHPHKALEYFREWRDEVGERADKKLGSVAEEKLRLLWTVSGPFFTDPFGHLEKRGVSVPFFQVDYQSRIWGARFGIYGDEKEYGRKLELLEEDARMLSGWVWEGPAERWIDDTLFLCRDLSLDGIVNFMQVGCTQTVGLATLLGEASERQLGIPTLNIEGRNLDTGFMDQSQFIDRLDAFVDMCMERKGVR